MGKQIDNIKLRYKVVKINTLKFIFEEIDEGNFVKLFNDNSDLLIVNLSTEISFDIKKSTISIDINTKLINQESKAELIKHSGRTTFMVEGLDKTYNKKEDYYDIPDELIIQLYGLAYSHSRALLTIEISPTIYKDKYFLPVINPSNFINKENESD